MKPPPCINIDVKIVKKGLNVSIPDESIKLTGLNPK